MAVVEDDDELEVEEDEAVEEVDALVAEVVEDVPEEVLDVEPPPEEDVVVEVSSQAMVPGWSGVPIVSMGSIVKIMPTSMGRSKAGAAS